jgi:hypothetical protein
MTPGWKVRVRGPRHGKTTRLRHRRPGAQRCYRQLWLVGAARNERGKQERDQRGPAIADDRTRKPLCEGGTTGPKQVVMLASTTPIAAMDVDVPIDRKDC